MKKQRTTTTIIKEGYNALRQHKLRKKERTTAKNNQRRNNALRQQ